MIREDAKLDFASEGQKVGQKSNECKSAYFDMYRRLFKT